MKIMLFLSLVTTIGFSGCKSNKQSKTTTESLTNNPNTTQTNFIGNWQWVKTSCCGRTPVITTPQTENTTITLNLKKDNTFERTVNGNTARGGTYEIKKAMEGENSNTIKLSTIPRDGYISIINDTLIINYGYIDLQTEFYIKK